MEEGGDGGDAVLTSGEGTGSGGGFGCGGGGISIEEAFSGNRPLI